MKCMQLRTYLLTQSKQQQFCFTGGRIRQLDNSCVDQRDSGLLICNIFFNLAICKLLNFLRFLPLKFPNQLFQFFQAI
jgi:hypothetical protein